MQQLKRVLTPSSIGILFYFLGSCVVLLAGNSSFIVNQLSNSGEVQDWGSTLQKYTDAAFGQLNNSDLIGKLTNILIWAAVGAAIYMVLWLALNISISVRNDIEVGTRYSTINSHGRLHYWLETAMRSAFRLGAALLILLLASLVVQIWYPVSVELFSPWLNAVKNLKTTLTAIEVVIGWLIVFHLLVVLLRLSLLKTRIVSLS